MPTVKFTTRWVQAVKPKATREEYFDDVLTGLVLRVGRKTSDARKRVRKTWRVAYRQNGRWRRVSIGTFPRMSLLKARGEATRILGHVADGRDPGDEKKARREAGTFSELTSEYLEKHAMKRKRSWREDHRILNGSPHAKKTGKTPHEPLVKRWGGKKVIEIRRRDVRELIDEIAERAPVMANRVLALLRKMWNYALTTDWPLLETNPCAGIEQPTKETRRDRVLSADEIKTLWVEAEKEDPTVAALVKLHLLTAQRSNELKRAAWSEIDLDAATWTIPAERSKNKMPHRVPLVTDAVAILNGSRERQRVYAEKHELPPTPWVFQSTRSRTHKPIGHAQKAIERIRGRCRFDCRIHDLRRTAASHMTSIGIPRLTVAKILNHATADSGVTAVYDRHSYDAEKRAALDLWASKLRAIVSGDKAENAGNVVAGNFGR